MATEWDPYAQHNEVPEVGYIDPPSVPYRYVSPVRRETIYDKNNSSKVPVSATKNISTPVKKAHDKVASPAKPSELLASFANPNPGKVCACGRPVLGPSSSDAATQTTLTMEKIAELEGGKKAVIASSSLRHSTTAGGGETSARSSSGKRVGVMAEGPKPRSKSNSRAPGSEAVVVAAPRATRVIGPTSDASPAKAATIGAGLASPPTSAVSALARGSAQQQLLEVTPTLARKMFSGSNGLRSTSSSNAASKVVETAALKRGKSSERVPSLTLHTPPPSGTGTGTAGAALQAAIARNLLRKQAATKAPDQFSAQNSSTATTGRRPAAEVPQQASEASPSRASTLASQLPTSLSSPIPVSLSKAAAKGTATPTSTSLVAPANKFARGQSTGSIGPTQRRVPSTAPSVALKATAPTVGASAVAAPSRTLSSRPVVRKSTTSLHVDPAMDADKEVKKAQAANQQIAHMQASLEGREKARQWQQAADEKVSA